MHDKMEVGTKVLLGVPAGLFTAQVSLQRMVMVLTSDNLTTLGLKDRDLSKTR